MPLHCTSWHAQGVACITQTIPAAMFLIPFEGHLCFFRHLFQACQWPLDRAWHGMQGLFCLMRLGQLEHAQMVCSNQVPCVPVALRLAGLFIV